MKAINRNEDAAESRHKNDEVDPERRKTTHRVLSKIIGERLKNAGLDNTEQNLNRLTTAA